jgi:hypothetical protein
MVAGMAFPLDGLRLLLPAIVPSWRFFDAVTASPRIDYALLPGAPDWRAFRPRPRTIAPAARIGRLVWNAQWNETLFLVSLAERLLGPAPPEVVRHSQAELLMRVARDLDRRGLCDRGDCLQVRLRLVDRAADEIAYVSAPCPIARLLTR